MKKIISIVLILTLLVSCLAIPTSAAALSKGSTGNDVTWHQKTLNFLGFDCGTADGIYGSKTVFATKEFQKAYGLTDDGIAGSKTLAMERSLIKDIQHKLNEAGCGKISVDGLPGSSTTKALKKFQRNMGLDQTGICDTTMFQYLNDTYESYKREIDAHIKEFEDMCMESWTLPLKDEFESISGSRKFATSREGGKRAHAGIDFVADADTTVYAMTAGTVIQVYTFYENTQAVEVQNDDGSILRYCEISSAVKAGDKVKQGDIVGTIMRATGGTEMLHLELYRGNASGGLTQRSNKKYMYVNGDYNYQRRSDLMDPTFLKDLDKLS